MQGRACWLLEAVPHSNPRPRATVDLSSPRGLLGSSEWTSYNSVTKFKTQLRNWVFKRSVTSVCLKQGSHAIIAWSQEERNKRSRKAIGDCVFELLLAVSNKDWILMPSSIKWTEQQKWPFTWSHLSWNEVFSLGHNTLACNKEAGPMCTGTLSWHAPVPPFPIVLQLCSLVMLKQISKHIMIHWQYIIKMKT